MMVKIVTFFLIGIAVLAVFGRLRMPKIGLGNRLGGDKRCKKCGAPHVGKGPCPCSTKG